MAIGKLVMFYPSLEVSDIEQRACHSTRRSRALADGLKLEVRVRIMGTFLEDCEIVRAVDVHAIVHWGQKLAAFNAVVRRVLLPRKIGVRQVKF